MAQCVSISVVKPAELVVTSIRAGKDKVKPGEDVGITVTVANAGGVQGSGTLELYEDVSYTQGVTVPAGGTQTINITVTAPDSVPSDGSLDVCARIK